MLLPSGAGAVGDAARNARASAATAGLTKAVPVGHGIECERPRALRLISPERTDREHHDVSISKRRVHDRGLPLHVLRIVQHPGHPERVGTIDEAKDHARARARLRRQERRIDSATIPLRTSARRDLQQRRLVELHL